MRKTLFLLSSAVMIAALVVVSSAARGSHVDGDPYTSPEATRADLETMSATRVLFAHQSVGNNIIDGLSTVYREQDLPAPTPVALADAGANDHFVHVRIGVNGDPLGKIREFESLVRRDAAGEIDVAVLKLCYTDVDSQTPVSEVFEAYRSTLSELTHEYPDTQFVAATVPLQVRRDSIGNLKALLGGGAYLAPEHNAARERFNSLLRAEYAPSNRLFDIAAIESTDPTGQRNAGRLDGDTFYALHSDYAADAGHLNTIGAARAAEGFVAVVADAARG